MHYWLSQADGIGYKKQELLIERYGSVREVAAAIKSDRRAVSDIAGEDGYKRLEYTLSQPYLQRAVDAVRSAGVELLCASDSLYPDNAFGRLNQKPLLIFFRGDLGLLASRGIAIVGTRSCSAYGRKMSEFFASALSHNGLTVVSGLATGIDAYAHRAALDSGGKTIAVLGNGHMEVSPAYNRSLAREIEDRGLVISEYLPFFKGSIYSYPARNRLIAALSDGVLVVEAGEKSGTRYTVEYAAELGKNIYCLPGNADSPKSRGNLNLIRAAHSAMVFEPEHILEDMNIGKKTAKNKVSGLMLDFSEVKILDLLSAGALNYENILHNLEMSVSELSRLLTQMELKGLIRKTGSMFSAL